MQLRSHAGGGVRSLAPKEAAVATANDFPPRFYALSALLSERLQRKGTKLSSILFALPCTYAAEVAPSICLDLLN